MSKTINAKVFAIKNAAKTPFIFARVIERKDVFERICFLFNIEIGFKPLRIW
jgi:hypothetical protein